MADIVTIALRGSLNQAPENTLPAIKKALEEKADVIALDVQASKDGVPVLMADSRLDRTTNGTDRVVKMTAKELQALDAGSWKDGSFSGTKIPTLAEAIKAVGKKAKLFLALPQVRKGEAITDNLIKDLKKRANPETDVLAFTDSASLTMFKESAPDFQYVLILDEKVDGWVLLKKAERLGLKIVRPHSQQVSGEFVGKAHGKGMSVWVHFADEEDEMEDVLKMKVDGIVTGRIPRLKRVLEKAAV